jgi:hypothetical protein
MVIMEIEIYANYGKKNNTMVNDHLAFTIKFKRNTQKDPMEAQGTLILCI